MAAFIELFLKDESGIMASKVFWYLGGLSARIWESGSIW
jgi:hypothetical protein